MAILRHLLMPRLKPVDVMLHRLIEAHLALPVRPNESEVEYAHRVSEKMAYPVHMKAVLAALWPNEIIASHLKIQKKEGGGLPQELFSSKFHAGHAWNAFWSADQAHQPASPVYASGLKRRVVLPLLKLKLYYEATGLADALARPLQERPPHSVPELRRYLRSTVKSAYAMAILLRAQHADHLD